MLAIFAVACTPDAQVRDPAPAAPAVVASGVGPSSAASSSAPPSSPPPPRLASKATVTELADAPKPSFGVAVDTGYVYWAVYEGGDVLRAPRAGGPSERLASGQDFVNAIAVDEEGDVFWSIGHGLAPGGSIQRLARGSHAATAFAAAQADAKSVAVDTTHVYWIVGGGYDGTGATANPSIRRKALRSGAVETVATGLEGPTRLVLDGDDVVFVEEGSPPYSGHGIVAKVPKRGGAVVVLAPLQTNPLGLAVDGGFVYWSVVGPLVTPPPRVCPKGTPCPIASAVPTADEGEVRRVPKSGGRIELLAKDLHHVGIVAASGGTVYFSADRATYAMPATGSAVSKIAPGDSSQMAFREGVGYAQLGGKIVALR